MRNLHAALNFKFNRVFILDGERHHASNCWCSSFVHRPHHGTNETPYLLGGFLPPQPYETLRIVPALPPCCVDFQPIALRQHAQAGRT